VRLFATLAAGAGRPAEALAGKTVSIASNSAYGCTIKYD
jgi:hypothetical protein